MSETKFTPAPWAVVANSIGKMEVVKQRVEYKSEKWIPEHRDATIAMGIGDHTDEETNGNELANAHLIAAAPEMYDLLERAVDQLDVMNEGYSADIKASGIISEVKTLLAKARGES